MDRDRLLVVVSSGQLAVGVAGLVVAVRRRRAYDIPFLRGDPRRVFRDSLLIGTAFSAPMPMLLAQAWATARLARCGDDRARRMLGVLGTMMVPGYLGEAAVRRCLQRSGANPVETPLAVKAVVLAAAMAVLSLRTDAARARVEAPVR